MYNKNIDKLFTNLNLNNMPDMETYHLYEAVFSFGKSFELHHQVRVINVLRSEYKIILNSYERIIHLN